MSTTNGESMKPKNLEMQESLQGEMAAFAGTTKAWNWKDWTLVGLIFLLALAVRLVYFFWVREEVWFINPIIDSLNYDQWARNIVAGDFLGKDVLVHSPFYPFFMAAIYALAGTKTTAVFLVQFVLGSISAGLLYVLGRQLFSRFAGTVAGLFEVFYGMAIFYEGTLLTVIVIHVLMLLIVASAHWAIRQKHPGWWALPGVLIGISVLTRPTILPFVGIVVVWMALAQWIQDRKKVIVASIVLSAATLTMILPVTLRNYVVMHEFMLTVGHGGLNFFLGNANQATYYFKPFGDLGLSSRDMVKDFKHQAEKETGEKMTYSQSSQYWFEQATLDIKDKPGRWVKLLAEKFLMFINDYEFTTSINYYAIQEFTPFLKWPWLKFGWLAPLAFLGMIFLWRDWRKLFLLYGLFAIYLFSNVAIFTTSEYRYAIMPAIFLFAAGVLEAIYRTWQTRRWYILVMMAIMLGVFGFATNMNFLDQEGKNYHMATAHSNFGNLLGRLKNFQGAAEEFSLALDYFKSATPYRANMAEKMGSALIDAHQYEDAIPAFEEAESIDPDSSSVANSLATAYTALGKYPEALKYREKAIRLAPENPNYHLNYGMTLLWAGQDKKADKAFAESVRLKPDSKKMVDARRAFILKERTPVKP